MNQRKGKDQEDWFRHMVENYARYQEENEPADNDISPVRRRIA